MSSTSSSSDITRMAGLASGLDTEALIKAATSNIKSSINAKKQKVQTLTWKQEAYRKISTALADFQSKYLDILSPTSIRANKVMKANKATSSNDLLSVTASASATPGKYSITSVKTATSAKLEGTKATAGTVKLDFSKASSGNNTVNITLDGTTKSVTFKGGSSADDAKTNFLDAVNSAFDGITSAKFAFEDGTSTLKLDTVSGDIVSHSFTVGYDESVGLKNDASNRLSTSYTLGNVDFATALSGSEYKFSINGVDFEFNSNTTVKEMMNTVNNSKAGVKMSFSSLSQTFTLESSKTGAGQELEISQTEGNLLNSLFNLGSSELGTVPTLSKQFTDKTVDPSVEFSLTMSANGLESGDGISVNGKTLSISGLTKTQNTDKITVNGEEVSCKLYENADGDKIYSYKQDKTTYYVKESGTDGKYDTVMTVDAEGTVNVGGTTLEDVTEADELKTLGIEASYKSYNASDIEKALNNAVGSENGTFSVTVYDDTKEAKITFTPAADKEISMAAAGNINIDDTGYTVNGETSNYTSVPYDESREITDTTSLSFSVNGGAAVTINGTGTDGKVTIADMVSSGYFVYDSQSGTLGVKGTDSISAADSDTASAFKDVFGTTTLAGIDNVGTKTYRGSNAQMTINGVTIESASNSFTVDGTTFNIEDMDEFTADDIANGDAEAITVTVEKDTSKIKETITNFVTAYNELIDTIYGELNTSRPKSDGSYYDPLTEEQEEEMEKEEIESWNEKAKTGLLYHDSTLSKVASNIRSVMSSVSVGGMTLQALGIDTSSDYREYGKLEIADESVLDSAIERYGEEIADFFTNTTNGLGTVLNNAVESAISTKNDRYGYLTTVAGIENTTSAKNNTIYSQLEALQNIIDTLNTRYEKQQERLWSQYSTLETYIANMNNQSTSLFGTSTS
ncbi:MAG: flagellar filament capping protein FliD [Huintestinicola sp.]